MNQHYEHYTKADQEVWKLLFTRQAENLANKACREYLRALEVLEPVLNANAIPRFPELDSVLMRTTGWTIEVVPGHIPVNDFFDLLARRRFPSSTWLRNKEQLDYLEEPDMFHDIFGHIPLLVDPSYADFMLISGVFSSLRLFVHFVHWFSLVSSPLSSPLPFFISPIPSLHSF